MIKKYVVGFMFDTSLTNVALIRKTKPAWQAGLLNGIGGKVEAGESFDDAMVREFSEEAGGHKLCWSFFNFKSGPETKSNDGYLIYYYFCIGEPHRLTSMEEEKIEVVPVESILNLQERTVDDVPRQVSLAIKAAQG